MVEKSVKILVADDTPANVKVIRKYMEAMGYQIVVAEDGEQAVKLFQSEQPDIVLMDVMMPNMDGYEATRKIRELAGDKWVPLVYLSAKVTVEDQIKGIEFGGDDYLTKPVDLRLLEAKLKAMLRIVNLQRVVERTASELSIYHEQNVEEIDLAKKLMENMMRQQSSNDGSHIAMFRNAAETISGDISLAVKSYSNKLYVLLADATGHGLSAAISQIPVAHTFTQMARKDFTVAAITQSINKTLKELLPPDRFVAATVVAIDFENRLIEIWNGSNPKPFFVSKSGEVLKVFEKSNFALGVVEEEAFSLNTDVFIWSEEGELLFFSDGLLDLANEQNELLGYDRIHAAACNGIRKESAYTGLIEAAKDFGKDNSQQDDLTIVSIRCS